MKRILRFIICIVFVCFLTGCSFVYNLEISDQIVEDNQVLLDVFEVEGDVKTNIYDLFIKYAGTTDGLLLYEQDFITRDNGLTGMSFLKKYSYDDYNFSAAVSACFKTYSVVNDDNIMTIATSTGFQCFDKYSELDEVTVNVTSKYKVVDNNADEIDGDTYTWFIDEITAEEEQLMISVDLNSPNDTLSFFQRNLLFFITLGAFAFVGLIYIFLKKRSEKVDKI